MPRSALRSRSLLVGLVLSGAGIGLLGFVGAGSRPGRPTAPSFRLRGDAGTAQNQSGLRLAASTPTTLTVIRSVTHAGLQRTYRLRIPTSVPRSAPLVLALHGGGSNARQMERSSGLNGLADQEGFIVAYPESGSRNWYDGREGDFDSAHAERRDDAGFLAAVVAAVGREHPVDRRRIYATGISNGAFMSHYFAATHAELVAAIAPVVGGIADPFHRSFAPSEPVSVLVVQGTEDPLVPYGSGDVVLGRGRVIPTEEALRLWRRANDCSAPPRTSLLPDRDRTDGCRVERTVWAGCRGGSEVVLLKMQGAGHTWPDGSQYLPRRVIGRVCRDFDASYLWEFFQSHPKGG